MAEAKEESFGRLAARAASPQALLDAEDAHGRAEGLAALDSLIGNLTLRALRGETLFTVEGVDEIGVAGRMATLRLGGLSDEERELLEDRFSLENQQARGSWSMPEKIAGGLGRLHFPHHLREDGSFFHESVESGAYGPISTAASPEALLVHTVLDPLFYSLISAAQRRDAEQLDPTVLGGRYRGRRLLPLVSRYYAKAQKDGRVLRRRVLTRDLESTLSGFFGGDWLAFLDYLGEEPHPEEHVATAVPEAKLYLGSSREVAEKLSTEGIGDEQLRLIAASLFGGETSPVEKRLSALRHYWQEFDMLHARQRSDMETLRGLVEEWNGSSLSFLPEDSQQRPGLFWRVLSADLLEEVGVLWGTAMLPRESGKIVTEPFPHFWLADTFGPPLRFWHNCALRAWFLCESPRPDMSGLEDNHRRELAELEDLSAPVDRSMFAELVASASRLKPPERVYELDVDTGLVIRTSMSSNSRRAGFESIRDVITKYRRAWAEAHLEDYLRSRAEGDVREATLVFYRKSAERSGKPPTPRQFARTAVDAVNRWFGGDISLLYRAFVERVYAALGGVKVVRYSRAFDEKDREERRRKFNENSSKIGLADLALDYLRLEEALGRPPTLKEIGISNFEHRAEEAGLGSGLEEAWVRYEQVVREALAGEVPKRQA